MSIIGKKSEKQGWIAENKIKINKKVNFRYQMNISKKNVSEAPEQIL